MRHAAKLALTVFAAAWAFAPAARAQSAPTTLTDGSVSTGAFLGEFRGGGGRLVALPERGSKGGATSALGFKIRFLMSDTPRQRGLPQPCLAGLPACEPGRALATSGRFSISETFFPSPAIVGGVRYPHVLVGGTFDFAGGSVVVPDSQEETIVLSAPVVMTGTLAVTRPGVNSALLFNGEVAAQGRALLRLRKATGGYHYTGITYIFDDPATAPPPPASLSLRAWLARTAERVGKTLGRGGAKF